MSSLKDLKERPQKTKLRPLLRRAGMAPAVCRRCGQHHWPEPTLRALFAIFLDELAQGRSVALPGLGTLTLHRYEARTVPDPRDPSMVFDLANENRIAFVPTPGARKKLNPGRKAIARKKDS